MGDIDNDKAFHTKPSHSHPPIQPPTPTLSPLFTFKLKPHNILFILQHTHSFSNFVHSTLSSSHTAKTHKKILEKTNKNSFDAIIELQLLHKKQDV